MKRLLPLVLGVLIARPVLGEHRAYLFGSALSEVKLQSDTPEGEMSDSSQTLLLVGGGLRFNRYLAAEISYFGPDEFQQRSSSTQAGVTTGTFRSWDIYALGLSMVAAIPLGSYVSIMAKTGVHWTETEVTTRRMRSTMGDELISADFERRRHSRVSPSAGAGAVIDSGTLMLRAWVERLYGGDFETLTTRTLQLGVRF